MKCALTARSLALLLVAVACATAPVTGRKEFNLVGDGTMNQLGQQTYAFPVPRHNPAPRPSGLRSGREGRTPLPSRRAPRSPHADPFSVCFWPWSAQRRLSPTRL